MSALAAIVLTGILHDKYQQLMKAGKAKKVVILANTLLRERRDWLPERYWPRRILGRLFKQ